MHWYLAEVKTAIYLRMSQDRTGDELGIDRYRELCLRVCARHGWTDTVEYVDNDVSASRARGPKTAYARLLADARAGTLGAVVVADLDRLTRTPREIEDWIDICESGGVRLVTADGEVDAATDNGRLFMRIKAAVARGEVERKGKRQRDAAAHAASQGRRIGGRRPFGYDAAGMRHDPAEADAVRWAYGAVLAGVSLGGIARRWNELRLHTPQSTRDGRPSRWTAQTVRSVLLNPRHAGLRSHVTREVRDRLAEQDGKAAGAAVDPRAARIAGIVGPAAWPGVVAEQTWRAAVALLTSPERAKPARSGTGLLTGVALCGVCGAPVHGGGAPASPTKPAYRTYRCTAALGHVGRAAEPVEWFVGEVIVERLSRPGAERLLEGVNRPDADEVRDRILELRTRRRNILDLVEDGTYTSAEARLRVGRLDRQILDANAELADAGRADILGPLVGADDVRVAWEGLGTDRRRAVIDALVVVTLMPPGRGTRTFRPESVVIKPRD